MWRWLADRLIPRRALRTGGPPRTNYTDVVPMPTQTSSAPENVTWAEWRPT